MNTKTREHGGLQEQYINYHNNIKIIGVPEDQEGNSNKQPIILIKNQKITETFSELEWFKLDSRVP